MSSSGPTGKGRWSHAGAEYDDTHGHAAFLEAPAWVSGTSQTGRARISRRRRNLRAGAGDPERDAPLVYVKHHFLAPYVTSGSTVLEIGPGGGRWTRYLLAARRVYVVDYHQELLEELTRNFARQNLAPVRNNGSDFPGVPPASVDFAFTFGVFAHLELDTIDQYLASLRSIMKPGANVVLQYSDETKPMGRGNPTFSKNSPERMRGLVKAHGYTILEEDLGTMWHSSIVRFTLLSA